MIANLFVQIYEYLHRYLSKEDKYQVINKEYAKKLADVEKRAKKDDRPSMIVFANLFCYL